MGSGIENFDGDKEAKMWRTAVEVVETETVQLEGTIPKWLSGCYYRVGPGKFDFGDNFSMTHWLDGYAIVSQFKIDAKKQNVTFQSKFLRSDSYQRAMKSQRPAVAEFATPAMPVDNKKGFFSRLLPQIVPETTDNTNHALFSFGKTNCSNNKLYTINGAGVMNEINPMTLDLQTQIDPSSHFGVNMCTAHPLIDEETGFCYNIGFSLVLSGLKYNVLRISALDPKGQAQKSQIICSIPTQWTTSLSFLHSFGMTKNFIVLIEQPLVINLTKMLNSSIRGKPEAFKDWLEWKCDGINKFYIIEKSTGRLVNKTVPIVSSELFFFFHFINCYEDPLENQIVMDLSTYENAEVLLGGSNLLSHVRKSADLRRNNHDQELLERSPKTKRFLIPLTPLGIDIRNTDLEVLGTIPEEKRTNQPLKLVSHLIIPDGGLELATINRKFAGKPYNYFYASGLLTQGSFSNSLCKVNSAKREVDQFRISDQYIFGEPIFVSSEASTEEDDGVLIVPMTDIRKSEPDILFFFDARNMTEIARAEFRNWIPSAMHGIYIPK